MPYPNVEPIREAIIKLGFEKATETGSGNIYVRQIGGGEFFLYLWEEAMCWDGYDTTHLEYRFDRPSGPERYWYVGWSYLPMFHSDGERISIGQNKFPTPNELRAAIIDVIATKTSEEEKKLKVAYDMYTTLASMVW